MALNIKLDKTGFDALDDSIKAHYKADGDSYILDADYEDVTGLKSKNSELLAQISKLKGSQLPSGMTAEEIAEALEFKRKAEETTALAKGEFEKVRQQIEDKAKADKEALQIKLESLIKTNAEKDLMMELVKNGVVEKQASRMAKLLQLESIKSVQTDEGSIVWRSLDDTQTIELDKYIPTLKEEWGEFFKANVVTGGGAAGNKDKGSAVKTMTRNAFERLNASEKAQFFKDGGSLTE